MAEFDLSKLGEYREHNQLEAKKAKGGFPGSFWETYSAFANTDGGIIHLWNNEDDEMFLRKIGAIGISEDGKYPPTAAGLLMFGYEYEITREFPNYFLDYQENRSLGATRWTDRIVSTSGDWSGNVFDFVIEALRRMQQGLKIPFVLKGNLRVDDTPIHKLLREAITNSCVHADFYGRQGLVIQKSEEGYKLANPGTVRISISDAIEGGISDPRNGIMLKIFSLIEFGERAGSGLSGICKRWEKVYHTPVTIEETHKNGVDRTVLTLPTGGHEQDVQAMLELYSDMVDPSEPQSDQETTRRNPESDQKEGITTQKTPPTTQKHDQTEDMTTQITSPTTQKSDQRGDGTTQKIPLTTQKIPLTTQKIEPQSLSTQEKILQELKKNPNLSRKQLAQVIPGISEDGIKYHLSKFQEKGIVRRVGPDKGGHWEILSVD